MGTKTHFSNRMHHYTEAEQTSLYVIADLVTIRLKNQHVPHIVARILDLAEVWQRSVVTRRESHHNRNVVRAFSNREFSSPGPFLKSKPVLGAGDRPVRRLKFAITGRCQEWHGDSVMQTQEGSWYQLAKRPSTSDDDYVAGPIIAYNDPGRGRYQIRKIVLNADDESEDAEWVQRLVNGDIVYIFSKAKGAAWANYTLAANIEVCTRMFAE